MKTDKKIVKYRDIPRIIRKLHRHNRKIVLTTGCFDIPHIGHLIHLNFCKSKGDILFVSVGNDKTVRRLKGSKRPIINEKLRAKTIAAFQVVDFVVISEEFGKMDHNRLVEILKPDIYVVPSTDSVINEKRELIVRSGGKFVIYNRKKLRRSLSYISTTMLERKINELS